jgi:hypothetical protein
MSWLTSGLTQSVTGKISQISGQLSGQLKDILADTTEDILGISSSFGLNLKELRVNCRFCNWQIQTMKSKF